MILQTPVKVLGLGVEMRPEGVWLWHFVGCGLGVYTIWGMGLGTQPARKPKTQTFGVTKESWGCRFQKLA